MDQKTAFRPKDAVIGFTSLAFVCVAVLVILIVKDVLAIEDMLSFDQPAVMAWTSALALLALLMYGVLITLCIPAKFVDDTNISYQHLSLLSMLPFMFAGALFEELLFRGITQSLFDVYFEDQWLAILSAALLFVGFHVQYFKKPLMLLNITISGIAFGWIYAETSNLLAPFIVHFLVNVGITLLLKYKWIRMRS